MDHPPGKVRTFLIDEKEKRYRLVLVPAETKRTYIRISPYMMPPKTEAHVVSASTDSGARLPITSKGIGPVHLKKGQRYVCDFELQEGFEALTVNILGNSHLSYSWPVLRPYSDDLVGSHFSCSFEVRRESKPAFVLEFLFSVTMEVTNERLLDYIRRRMAQYCFTVKCDATGYSGEFTSSTDQFQVGIPVMKLQGPVRISADIVATRKIAAYKNKDLHEDYEGRAFRIEKGDVLASDARKTCFIMISSLRDLEGRWAWVYLSSRPVVYDLYPDGDLAKDEFYHEILPAFLERRSYTSRHFSPHRFIVVTKNDKAELKVEIKTAAGIRRGVLASWEGKTLTYMPRWPVARLAVCLAEWVLGDGVVTDPKKPFLDIIEADVRSLEPKKEWKKDIKQRLFTGTHREGVEWEFKLYDGKLWRYACDYPYTLDVRSMRIMNPDIISLFLKADDPDRWGFSTILKGIGSKVPDGLKEAYAKKLEEMQLDRSVFK